MTAKPGYTQVASTVPADWLAGAAVFIGAASFTQVIRAALAQYKGLNPREHMNDKKPADLITGTRHVAAWVPPELADIDGNKAWAVRVGLAELMGASREIAEMTATVATGAAAHKKNVKT